MVSLKRTARAALPFLLFTAGCATAPPPAPVSDARSCGRTPASYEVKRGDTLFGIGWAYCLDYRDIARWNRLRNPNLILVGQTLRLRPSEHRGAVPTRPRQADRPAAAGPPSVARAAPAAAQPALTAMPEPGAATGAWRWPTAGKIVSPFAAGVPGRNGIRISAQPGQTVRAASPGLIVYTGNSLPGYGTLIIVEHAGGLLSAYGRLGRMLVNKGDRVRAGDAIAELGNDGDDGSTLHFEIRKNGQPVNPLTYLPS